MELLGTATRLDPRLRRARLNHAQLLVSTGAAERALAEYRAALRGPASDAAAWAAQDSAEAESHSGKGLEIDPRDREAHDRLAMARRGGRREEQQHRRRRKG